MSIERNYVFLNRLSVFPVMADDFQVSGGLLHHMETVDDIQEYCTEITGFLARRLLRKLKEIRANAVWAASIAPASSRKIPK